MNPFSSGLKKGLLSSKKRAEMDFTFLGRGGKVAHLLKVIAQGWEGHPSRPGGIKFLFGGNNRRTKKKR